MRLRDIGLGLRPGGGKGHLPLLLVDLGFLLQHLRLRLRLGRLGLRCRVRLLLRRGLFGGLSHPLYRILERRFEASFPS